MRKTTVLVILDGWGMAPASSSNAIIAAHTPCFDKLWNSYPHALLKSWGAAVGLADDMVGNSEVGHLTIGTGTIVEQRVVTITREIVSGEFATRSQWSTILNLTQRKTVHLIGLLSTSGVHASRDHLLALYDFFTQRGYQVFLHLFTDGRDAGIHDARALLEALPQHIVDSIQTLCGRFYGMDRNKNWSRTEAAYTLIMQGKGVRAVSVTQALHDSYDQGVTDEFIKPTVLNGYCGADSSDLFFFFNFREDRLRQLATAFINSDGVTQETRTVASLVEFEDESLIGIPYLYPKLRLENTLAAQIAAHRLTQVHIAENEKYAQVTYFFNGGNEQPHEGEQFVVVPSLPIVSYDEQPEMSAAQITQAVVQFIGAVDFIVVNYANADMVGHTGNFDATVRAVEFLDQQLQEILTTVQQNGGSLIITSDHGNAEVMKDPETGEIDTKHNANPSPLIVVSSRISRLDNSARDLTAIASLVLKSLGVV